MVRKHSKKYTKKDALKDARWIRRNTKGEIKVGSFKGNPIVKLKDGNKYLKVKNKGKYQRIVKYNYILI